MFKDNRTKIKYADIIDLPHHVSTKRPRMEIKDRAAQFAPFAALTGHDAAVKETARLTDERIELDQDEIAVINEKLQMLHIQIQNRPEAVVTYFVKDSRKEGGMYRTVGGTVKRIKEYESILVMDDGTEIPIKDITDIEI